MSNFKSSSRVSACAHAASAYNRAPMYQRVGVGATGIPANDMSSIKFMFVEHYMIRGVRGGTCNPILGSIEVRVY